MKGIDISHWNCRDYKSYIREYEPDFVIAKASEGVHMNDNMFEEYYKFFKKENGTLFGAYHFATSADPGIQAIHFYDVVKNHVGEILLALDFEGQAVNKWGVSGALTFLKTVERLTGGVKPLIYMNKSVLSKFKKNWAQVAKDYGLWLADYKKESTISVEPWTVRAIRQYDNFKVDKNVAYMTPDAWQRYAIGDLKTGG